MRGRKILEERRGGGFTIILRNSRKSFSCLRMFILGVIYWLFGIYMYMRCRFCDDDIFNVYIYIGFCICNYLCIRIFFFGKF